MRYCKNCNLTYGSSLNHCLFCNNELISELESSKKVAEKLLTTDESISFHYPSFQKRKKILKYFVKLIYFLVIISIASCIFLDLTVGKGGINWSAVPAVCCFYFFYLVRLYTSKQKRIKKITVSAYASIIFLLLIGLLTKTIFWAIDFILPLGIFATNLCLTYYFLFRKRKALHDIAIYNLVASLLGLIPLVLYFSNQLTYSWPSIVCGLYSLVIISGLIFFSTSQTKEELRRRFHL